MPHTSYVASILKDYLHVALGLERRGTSSRKPFLWHVDPLSLTLQTGPKSPTFTLGFENGSVIMGLRQHRPNLRRSVAHRIPFFHKNAPSFSRRNMFWKCDPKGPKPNQEPMVSLNLTKTDHGFANWFSKNKAVTISIGHLFEQNCKEVMKNEAIINCVREKLCADLVLLPDYGSSSPQKMGFQWKLQKNNFKKMLKT